MSIDEKAIQAGIAEFHLRVQEESASIRAKKDGSRFDACFRAAINAYEAAKEAGQPHVEKGYCFRCRSEICGHTQQPDDSSVQHLNTLSASVQKECINEHEDNYLVVPPTMVEAAKERYGNSYDIIESKMIPTECEEAFCAWASTTDRRTGYKNGNVISHGIQREAFEAGWNARYPARVSSGD